MKSTIGYLLLAIVLIAGGAGWFFFLREPDPQAVIKKMIVAMEDASSFHYESSLEVGADLSQVELPDMAGSLAPQDRKVTGNLLLSGDLSFDAARNLEAVANVLDFYLAASSEAVNSPSIISLGVENRLKDKVNYFKFTNLSLGILPIELSSLKDVWYKIENNKLFSDLESKKSSITGEPPKSAGLTPAVREEIRLLARDTKFFLKIEKMKAEKIGRVRTRHYRATLDPKETMNFIKKTIEISGGNVDKQLKFELDNFEPKLTDAQIELWIGRSDYLLYRSKLNWPLTFDVPGESSGKSEPVSIMLTSTTNLSKFNEPVSVTAPEGAKNLQDLLGSLLGGLIGGGLPKSDDLTPKTLPTTDLEPTSLPDTKVPLDFFEKQDTDGDGLTDVEESFWGTSVTNPDTDGDGYSDGEEVKTNHNPLGPGNLF